MSFDFSSLTEEEAMGMMYPKQLEAYKACRWGNSDVLVVASGGYGKSFIIDALRYYSGGSLVVTATSGVAATNVSAATAHSTLALPLGIPTEKDIKKVSSKYRSLFKKNHPVEGIIIDEVSMVGPETFDSILQRRKRISKTCRTKHTRLLMFGDFFQIPNVIGKERDLVIDTYGTTKLLNSKLFNKCIKAGLEVFELDQNKRSGDDKIFTQHLENLRRGVNVKESLDYFNKYVTQDLPLDAVYLTAKNETADRINQAALDFNPEDPWYYHAKISGNFEEKDSRVPKVITLKKGLRVMSVYNDNENELFVNGSMGTVRSLGTDMVEVDFDHGVRCWVGTFVQEKKEYFTNNKGELDTKVVADFEQIGLKPCAAISIHKAQGLSLNKIVVDLEGGAFEYGQVYVALSRLTNIKGLHLVNPITAYDIKVCPAAKKFYAEINGQVYDPSKDLSNVPEHLHKYKIRVIIAGGRDFNDFQFMTQSLDHMLRNYNREDILIIEGGAKGADRLGRNYAKLRGIDFLTVDANWKDLTTPPLLIKSNAYGEYNALAGTVRNHKMGDISSHAVVYWDGESRGSKDMINYMKTLMKPVKVFKYA